MRYSWYFSLVENPMLSGSIRMEGMQCFASKNKGFCVQIRMDGKLSQTELSSLKLLSTFDLASCFPIIKKKKKSSFGFKCSNQGISKSRNVWQIHVATLM